MKRLLLVLLLLASGLNTVSAQQTDCDPAALKEWMVQRQIGRNRLQPILDSSDKTTSVADGILLVQQVRRDLEDLPRPACADDLYNLTIYFYNAVTDGIAFGLKNDSTSVTNIILPRLQRYQDNVDALYLPLESITGINVMEEAATRGTVLPTAQPTLAPLQFQGQTGGTVIGPTDIPAGIYKLVLTGAGSTVNLSSVKGNCTAYIYVPSNGTTTEEVFRSDGCSVLMEVSPSNTPWSLTFTPVS